MDNTILLPVEQPNNAQLLMKRHASYDRYIKLCSADSWTQIQNFWKLYEKKKYLDIPAHKVLEMCGWNLSILKEIVKMLAHSKMLLYTYLIIFKHSKKGKKWIDKSLLKEYGFGKSSINFAINELKKLKLIWEENGQVKCTPKCLLKKDKGYYKFSGDLVWRGLFILSVKCWEVLMKVIWLSKQVKKNKAGKNRGQLKEENMVHLQNNFLGLSQSTAYRFLKKLSFLLGNIDWHMLFRWKKTYDTEKDRFKTLRMLKRQIDGDYAIFRNI
ncbi:MAGa4850 family ICE element protein [Mycoplasmopsis primatum]|uniref:MAGa4850 family ICE element protein n=1 Tax=Mycoplasmopsis primatum TaxID=55604 RepID=UPI00049840DE|nr:hypothetical protein [Mycoplasmopsis primatum]